MPVALGLVIGAAVDDLVGDPRRGHPVAGHGRVVAPAEQRFHADHVLGGTGLTRAGDQMAGLLADGRTDAAWELLPTLCGRDPAALDAAGLARATVESVAENTSDAMVAPLVWGALPGLPGLLGDRAVNTLDAMIGHRSTRYAQVPRFDHGHRSRAP